MILGFNYLLKVGLFYKNATELLYLLDLLEIDFSDS